jgi:anhydro-N-acetylmuramic acid kinase
LTPVAVAPSDKYGIPVMAKEAACFAWLALRAFHGRANNCPQATGARGRRVLGKLIPL